MARSVVVIFLDMDRVPIVGILETRTDSVSAVPSSVKEDFVVIWAALEIIDEEKVYERLRLPVCDELLVFVENDVCREFSRGESRD